jgi:uncharacterized membrane protein
MNKEERIKKINIENNIWVIYLIIIGLSYLANYFEKNFFETNNQKSKNTYQKLNALVFIILIIIYSYFEKDAIESYKEKNNEFFSTLILIATTLVLISGIIFLYIIIVDTNIEEEIAFN